MLHRLKKVYGDWRRFANSNLLLFRFLIHPEVNEGSEESELGEGGEDQEERLDLPVEVNALHLVEQQKELAEVLKIGFI